MKQKNLKKTILKKIILVSSFIVVLIIGLYFALFRQKLSDVYLTKPLNDCPNMTLKKGIDTYIRSDKIYVTLKDSKDKYGKKGVTLKIESPGETINALLQLNTNGKIVIKDGTASSLDSRIKDETDYNKLLNGEHELVNRILSNLLCGADNILDFSKKDILETQNDEDNTQSNSINKNKQKSINTISTSKYFSLLKSNEKSVIYMSKEDCKYCEIETPIIKNIYYENPKISLYQINISDISSKEWSQLYDSNELFSKEGFGFPAIIIIENGNIIDSVIGTVDKEEIIDLLENNDII